MDNRLLVEINRYDPGFGTARPGIIWRIFQKLRRLSTYKDLNIYKIFEPLDPGGFGRVSANAFVSCLMSSIGYLAGLSRLEIEEIAHYYVDAGTNTVDYHSFAEFIHKLEYKTLHEPPLEYDVRGSDRRYRTAKDKVEFEALMNIIDYLACVMVSRRIHIDPYIREYENSTHMVGLISIPQLERVFSKMGIMLRDEDFRLICKWYGKFGYLIDSIQLTTAFREATKRICRRKKPHPTEVIQFISRRPLNVRFPKRLLPHKPGDDFNNLFQQCDSSHACQDVWNFMREDTLSFIQRLQKAVYTLNLPIRSIFQQFDPSNSGRCTVPQFRRALDSCGFNRTGRVRIFISPQEMQDLINLYSDPHQGFNRMIIWKAFVEDIESGTYIRELNRKPTADVKNYGPYGPSPGVLNLPCKYAGKKSMALTELRHAERVMEYVKNQSGGCNFYQFFNMFDRRNRGHVSKSQFRDVLRMCKIYMRSQDYYDIERFFTDYHGVCYRFFLQLLGETEPPPVHKRPLVILTKQRRENAAGRYEAEGKTIEEVMRKIRETVFHRNLRLKDWFEEYDRFRTGIVTRDRFVRALVSAYDWTFSYCEYKILLDMFSKPYAKNDVHYKPFLDAVNEVYTQKSLEHTPLIIPVPFQGCREIHSFSKQELDDLGNSMQKLVRQRVDIADLPIFQNYDAPAKRNALTYQQYLQALDSVGALQSLSVYEQQLIFKAFSRVVNRWLLFDYREFLKACHYLYLPRFEEQIE